MRGMAGLSVMNDEEWGTEHAQWNVCALAVQAQSERGPNSVSSVLAGTFH